MSRLRIEHRTAYRYSKPVSFGRHRLVLRPREGHDMHVEKIDFTISPNHRLTWTRDVFGNSIGLVDFLEKSDQLEILSTATVLRSSPYPDLPIDTTRKLAFPPVYDPLEASVASAYLQPIYSDDRDEVVRWLKVHLPVPDPTDAERTIAALGEIIHRKIRYQRRPERGVQTPAQTIGFESGSCRDMATLMMEGARSLGVAARFASGYLDCAASTAGQASMHAWTEIYLPQIGWHGFDPTIGQPTSLKHVLTGVSNHPRGVMPVSGTFDGTLGEYLGMDVQVKIVKLT